MLKTIMQLVAKLLENKLKKSGLEETILKNQNYIIEGKKIWRMIDENYRISKTIEEKLASKTEQFDKLILNKFPELTEEDITQLRQSIAGEFNADKAAVIDNSDLLKQLQADNDKFKLENANLKDQLAKIQTVVTPVVQA